MHLELLKGCMLAPSRDNRKNNFHTRKFICMINSKRFPEKPDQLGVRNSLPFRFRITEKEYHTFDNHCIVC